MLRWTNIKSKLKITSSLFALLGFLYIFKRFQYPVAKPSPAYVIGVRRNKLPLHTAITADDNTGTVFHPSSEIQKADFQLFQKSKSRLKVKAFNSDLNGVLNVHIWDEICTEKLDNLRHYPIFPNMPSRRMLVDTFKVTGIGYDCGVRIFGYIKPVKSGAYRFALSVSHGESELWLSSTMEPQDLKLICPTDSYISNPQKLNNGHAYYVEALYKIGVRTPRFEVKWSLPDDTDTFNVINSSFIKPFFDDSGVSGKEVINEFKVPPYLDIHKKLDYPPHFRTPEINKRRHMIHLPYIEEGDVENLFPTCPYNPSYIIKSGRTFWFKGVWETHYTSVYPIDATNLTLKLKDGSRQIQFGNDVLDENRAQMIVNQVVRAVEKHRPGKYKFLSILNVEENPDPDQGSRFLVELELLAPVKGKVRFSEYVYLPKGKKDICYPENFKWNKNAVVNLILTVGNQGRWAKYFVDAMSEIYEATKDKNMNIIIVDFNSQDVDLAKALEDSPLPRYMLLNKFNLFYKTEAIQQAANSVQDTNSILLQVDLHSTFPVDFIDNVRKHCVQGKMAYSPLLVRLSCDAFPERPMGFWEVNGYGIFGIYKSDWDTIGGMNVEKFRNKWGGEDWDLLDRCLLAGYEIERLKLRHFNHVYHSKTGMWHRFRRG